MAYFELVHNGRVIAASTSLKKAQSDYTKAAESLLNPCRFKSYEEAHSFIFEAGLESELFIRTPEYEDEDESILGTP